MNTIDYYNTTITTKVDYIAYACSSHFNGYGPYIYTYKMNYHVSTITELLLHIALLSFFIWLQISLMKNLRLHIKSYISNNGQLLFMGLTFFLYVRGMLEILGYSYQILGFLFDYPIDMNYQLLIKGIINESRRVFLQTYIAYCLNFLPILTLQLILCINAEKQLKQYKESQDNRLEAIHNHYLTPYILFVIVLATLIITTCLHNCQESIDTFQLLIVIYIFYTGCRYFYCSNEYIKGIMREQLEHDSKTQIQWIQGCVVISSFLRIVFQSTRFLTSPNYLLDLCGDNSSLCEDLLKSWKLRGELQIDDKVSWAFLQFAYYLICDVAPQYLLMKCYQYHE